jgi:hypothetical protein
MQALWKRAGWGEDNPIVDIRLARDGWRLIHSGTPHEHGIKNKTWIDFDPPELWAKPNLKLGNQFELEMQLKGIKERGGSWYIIEHVVKARASKSVLKLGRTDWADWCHSGDLLFAKNGKLFRLVVAGKTLPALAEAKLLIDLNERKFKEMKPTDEATRWGA